MTRICLFGGGAMGSALLEGMIKAGGAPPSEYAVVEPQKEARRQLAVRFPEVVVTDEPHPAEGAILAMKPVDVESCCKTLSSQRYARVLSIAAGVTLSSLERWLWPEAHVIRSMPNTPALLGAGASAIAGGRAATEEDLAWAESILGSVGIVVRVDEPALDAVTGLSGSGPAYVFYLAESLISSARAIGLDEKTARSLTIQTLLGSARMLDETGRSAEELRKMVTSPNGTTAAGIAELDRHGFRDAVRSAVQRATERSIELGRSSD